MSGSLADLFIRVGADSSGVRSGLKEGDRALTETEQRWQKAGAGMRNAGQTLTRNLTLPMIAAGAVAVKTAIDFDTSMSRIQGLAGATAAEIDTMRGSVLALSAETSIGPQRLADAMYFIASSGVTGAAALDALEMSAKASAAGLGDVEVVADAVTSAMNSYADSGLTAAQATDVLVGMVKEGKGEASEFAGQLGRILPFASQLGVSFEDLGAGLAYLTRGSGDSRLATTQLGGALQKLLVPSQQGRRVLDEVGLSADGVRAMIQEKGLLGALVELDERFGGSEQKWKMLVEEGQAVAGIMQLVKNGGEDAAPVFESLADSAGATENAFSAFAESAGFQSKQAFAELQVALIQMGDQLIPLVSGLARAGAAVASFFGGLPSHTQVGILAFAGFLAAVGPMLTLGGNLIKVWGMMPAAITGAVQSLIAATQAAYAANPVLTLVAVAATAAAAAMVLFSGSNDPEPVRELTAAIQEQEGALGELSRQWLGNELMGSDWGREMLRGMNEMGVGLDELEAKLAEGGDALREWWMAHGGADDLGLENIQRLSEQYRASADAAELAGDAGIDAGGGLAAMGDDAAAAEAQLRDMTGAIEELFAAALGTEGARIQFELGLMDIRDAIAEGTFSLDENTRAGLQNRQALIGMANDAKAHAAAVFEETGSIEQANFTLGAHINQLAGVLQATGMTEEGAARYIATLLGIPEEEVTDIRSNADLVEAAMKHLDEAIGDLPPVTNANISSNAADVASKIGIVAQGLKNLDGTVSTVTIAAKQVGDTLPKRARGGPVYPGRAYLVGEEGPELATFGQAGHITNAAETARMMAAAANAALGSGSTGPGALTATPGAGMATTTREYHFYRVSLTDAIARVPGEVRERARAFLEGRS